MNRNWKNENISGLKEHVPLLRIWFTNGVMWEFECLWENSRKTRVLWPQFFQNTELFLDCFCAPPRYREQESVYFGLLIIACCCYSIKSLSYPFYNSRENMLLSCAACPCDCILYTYTEYKCLILWIEMAIAWDFNLSHLLCLFSQVPPPLE